MDPAIRLDGITKRFGKTVALDKVSLEVPRGVVFALLGENGAGKTTAIRIMLGLAEPDEGTSTVLGLDSEPQGIEVRRRIGYVPERPTLYDWMTVGEIGWFTAGFYGNGFLPEYQRLIEQFGLPVGRKLKSLSKGMHAKVALSLALAHEPELLILDEPTSGLDALVRREFLESMVDRAAAGQTVFLSSHQINEVERVADIVAIVRQGHLALIEPLDELKARTREVTISLHDDAAANRTAALPEMYGEVVDRRCRGRQYQLLVRDMSEEQPARLLEQPTVAAVDVRAPSLEEIFVGYMERREAGGPESAEKEE